MPSRPGLRALVGLALVALAACAPRARLAVDESRYVRVGPLEISGFVEREMVDIFAAAQVMNTSRQPLEIAYAGACGVALVIYHPDRPQAAPAWDSERLGLGLCPPTPDRFEIPPETLARLLAPAFGSEEIRGDSLARGRYLAAVRLHLLHPRDTTLLLSAGPLDLD